MIQHSRTLKQIGSYQPLLELGQGGMGVAYLARAVGSGGFERLVVVKRLHRHLLHENEARERFLHEARLAAYVHHANVVGVHQAGSDEEGQYIVLEYVEGTSLDELVDRAALKGTGVPTPILLRILIDALTGLQAIHDAADATGRPLHILHRDVSPQNVLIGRDGLARMSDLGVAKSSIASMATDKAYVVGKLAFMSPEYLRREDVDRTLDVYAMGVTAWMAFAGRDPWPNANEAQLVTFIVTNGMPPLLSAIDAPPQIAAIVDRACAHRASDRFQTARDMARAIEEVGKSTGWVATHADVADFVESLLGVDLARRRERVSTEVQRISQLSLDETVGIQSDAPRATPPPADEATASLAPEGAPGAAQPGDAARRSGGTGSFSFHRPAPSSGSGRAAWLLSAIAVVVVAGGVLLWRQATEAPRADATQASSNTAAGAPPAAPRPSEQAEPAPSAGPVILRAEDLPVAEPAAEAPAAPRATPSPQPRRASAPPPAASPPPKPAAAPVDTSAAEDVAPPRDPRLDGITKRNPYR